jgi:acyl carrier protein
LTTNRIFSQIADIIASQFGIAGDQISRETTAYDVPGWDSIQHVYLIMSIETAFSVRLKTDQVFGLENVGELADLIRGQVETK